MGGLTRPTRPVVVKSSCTLSLLCYKILSGALKGFKFIHRRVPYQAPLGQGQKMIPEVGPPVESLDSLDGWAREEEITSAVTSHQQQHQRYQQNVQRTVAAMRYAAVRADSSADSTPAAAPTPLLPRSHHRHQVSDMQGSSGASPKSGSSSVLTTPGMTYEGEGAHRHEEDTPMSYLITGSAGGGGGGCKPYNDPGMLAYARRAWGVDLGDDGPRTALPFLTAGGSDSTTVCGVRQQQQDGSVEPGGGPDGSVETPGRFNSVAPLWHRLLLPEDDDLLVPTLPEGQESRETKASRGFVAAITPPRGQVYLPATDIVAQGGRGLLPPGESVSFRPHFSHVGVSDSGEQREPRITATLFGGEPVAAIVSREPTLISVDPPQPPYLHPHLQHPAPTVLSVKDKDHSQLQLHMTMPQSSSHAINIGSHGHQGPPGGFLMTASMNAPASVMASFSSGGGSGSGSGPTMSAWMGWGGGQASPADIARQATAQLIQQLQAMNSSTRDSLGNSLSRR